MTQARAVATANAIGRMLFGDGEGVRGEEGPRATQEDLERMEREYAHL